MINIETDAVTIKTKSKQNLADANVLKLRFMIYYINQTHPFNEKCF
jgi:hypothetical protein